MVGDGLLPDWYFCCCVKADPDKSAIFLQILDALEDVDRDSDLADLAVQELGRMDVWMQGYALPAIIRYVCSQRPPAKFRKSLDSYFSDLADAMPEEFSGPFWDLREALLGAGGSSESLAALRRCALALRGLPARQTSAAPYLDLREFLPEAVVLAVFSEQLPRDRAYSELLGGSDEAAAVAVNGVLEAGLAHELGRLSFRLALRVAVLGTTRHPSEELADLLWNPRFSTEFEPDLLASWAELLGTGQHESREALATALVHESITLAHLTRRLAARRPAAGSPRVASALLPAPSEDIGRPLATVLWQAALWQLAVRTEPNHAASLLADLWRPPGKVAKGTFAVRVPLSAPARRKLWDELYPLLRLRRLRTTFSVDQGSEIGVPKAGWTLFSPWIDLNVNRQVLKHFDPEILRYPMVQHVAVQVRLAAATALACRLLLILAADHCDRPSFAALLVHTSDVLESLQLPGGIPGVDRAPAMHRLLTRPFLGLAIFLRRRIHRLASCRDQRLAPEDFLGLFAQGDSEATEHSYDEGAFARTILPAVLLSWVHDAFPSATRSSGSRRWLARVCELYDRQSAQSLWHSQLMAELLVRFLYPSVPGRKVEFFDWRRAARNGEPLRWRVRHRQLLLTPALCADEWDRPDWEDGVSDASTQLVRALERLAALKDPGELPTEARKRWRAEWADLLSRVNSPKLLDRFVRLRLYELLVDDSLLADDPPGRELIALTLVEYGSLFEIERLLDHLYPTDEVGWRMPPDRGVQDLQLTVLHALFQDVGRSPGPSQWRPNPQDLHHVRSEHEKERLIREALRRIALFAGPDSAAPHQDRLRNALAALYERRLAERAGRLRRIEADVELRPDGKQLVLPEEDAVSEWQVRSVAFDPNFLRARLLVEDVSRGDAKDLFTLGREELQTFLAARSPANVVAVAVGTSKREGRGQHTAYFNCGLRRYLKATTNQAFENGDPVRLVIAWPAGSDRPEIDARYRIARLPTAHRPSRPLRLRVREYRRGTASSVEQYGADTSSTLDRRTWMADLSWCFRRIDHRQPRQADWESHAVADGSGALRPLQHGVTEFLLSLTGRGGDRVAVLTFLGPGEDGDSWLFSAWPGEVYLLSRADFASDDVDEIEEEIERHREPHGLLFSLQPEASDGRIWLRLRRCEVRDVALLERYPHLETPFDRRNLVWRDLFRTAEMPVAYVVDGSWKIELSNPPPGFPARVHVSWRGPRPEGEGESEVTVVGWDPWKAEAIGESVRTYQLQLSPDITPRTFVTRWLTLRRGERVHLARVISPVTGEGDVRCRTVEGLVVWADAESLSMRFLADDTPLEIPGGRLAEVTSQRWVPLSASPILDSATLPEEIRQRGYGQGVLARVPRRTASGTLCEVWWDLGDRLSREAHQIEDLGRQKVMIGDRITAKTIGSEWSFQIDTPLVRVQGLWTLARWDRPTPGLAYLDRVALGGETLAIAEKAPGQLLILPSEGSPRLHLAEGDGLSFQGGLESHDRTENSARRKWRVGRNEFRRATLPFRRGVLCGTCWADAPAQAVVVTHVRLTIERREEGFGLRRSFRLTTAQTPKPERPRSSDDVALWKRKLDEYFASPGDLDCRLDVGRREVRLFELRVPPVAPAEKWTNTVRLADNEGPFIASASYATEGARVRLFEHSDGSVWASFKRVPAQTIDGFREHVRATFDEVVKLSTPLYYAGPEGPNGPAGETCHRFEWGYGWTLAAPESRLRFDGQPFRTARSILFFGDAVTGLTFVRGIGAGPGAKEPPLPDEEVNAYEDAIDDSLLDVNGLQLALSDATSLFLQRSRFSIVHLLRLRVRPDGTLDIRSILGLEDRSLQATRAFRVDRAVLDSTSAGELRQRWSAESIEEHDTRDSPSQDHLVLARLDEERFRASIGLDVVFQLVRMSFSVSPTVASLRQGELVFMRAGTITPLRNDTGLEILPWKGLDKEDLGQDCQRLLLLRRRFSVRQDLLSRILDGQGAEALEGSALLVHLRPVQGRISCALWWNEDRKSASGVRLPMRTLAALRRAASEDVLLASVLHADATGLRVELKPGVFVALPEKSCGGRPNDLRTGDLVRIESVEEKGFRITRAAPSEEWFLAHGARLVTVLPLNALLDPKKVRTWDSTRAQAWSGPNDTNRCFSIGGLPNLLAVPGSFELGESRWSPPVSADFIHLMRTPHPKIGLVGRDAAGVVRLQPAPGDLFVGGLHVDPAERTVHFSGTSSQDASSRAMRCQLLSFADEPFSQLAIRIEDERWRYHDTETGTWLPTGNIEIKKLGTHRLRSGPLFFEPHANDLRLRYTEASLPRYGFPVRELVSALLNRKGRTARLPVAGLLEEGGLWIELAPGRVAGLPAALVIVKVDGREQSLSHMHWPAFAPGDQVTLSLSSSDPMATDRIALEDWAPGPRRALGSRSLLPIVAVDRERGATTLGGGGYTLDVPLLWEEASEKAAVFLSWDNNLADKHDRLPERNDTVLLGLNTQGRPVVLGLPEYRPLPEALRPANWELDPLVEDVAAFGLAPGRRDDQLATAITAAGGAIPVTVELALEQKRVLYFSRRTQRAGSVVAEGRVTFGRALGLLRDEATVLVRCGSGLVKVSLQSLVSGLPKELNVEAVEALRKKRTVLWLRGGCQGEQLRSGLADELGSVLNVQCVTVLGYANDGAGPRGLICRSLSSFALYWLPAGDAAWTPLALQELVVLFPSERRFRVRLSEDKAGSRAASMTGVADVRKELAELRVGRELEVQVVSQRTTQPSEPTRYLVAARSSGVALEMETYEEDTLATNQAVLVEVLRRGFGMDRQPTVTCVPVGKRRYFLDLPRWIAAGGRRREGFRPGFQEYLRWTGEDPAPPAPGGIDVQAASDADLCRGLCHAWRLRPGGASTLDVVLWQTKLAREWLRRTMPLSEIDLPYSLIATLLLCRTASRGWEEIAALQPSLEAPEARSLVHGWHREAFRAVQDLGQRAMRSFHVEVLWQDWLRPDAEPPRVGDLRHRLRQLEEALGQVLEFDVLSEFQHYCDAVELRESLPGYAPLQPLADALRRATGGLERTKTLIERAEIVRGLVEIYRSIPAGRGGQHPDLLPSHIRKLETLLEAINARRIDVVLLDPLTGNRMVMAHPHEH